MFTGGKGIRRNSTFDCIIKLRWSLPSELPLFLASIYSFCNTSPVGLFTLPCRLTRSPRWILNEAPSLKAAKFTKADVVEARTKIETRTSVPIRQFIYYSLYSESRCNRASKGNEIKVFFKYLQLRHSVVLAKVDIYLVTITYIPTYIHIMVNVLTFIILAKNWDIQPLN